MTATQLGLPEVPVLRRKSRAMMVGSVPVGGGAAVAIQSMTTTPAREADLGVSSGNGKGQIFVKGEIVRTVPENQIVEVLLEEAMSHEWPASEDDG